MESFTPDRPYEITRGPPSVCIIVHNLVRDRHKAMRDFVFLDNHANAGTGSTHGGLELRRVSLALTLSNIALHRTRSCRLDVTSERSPT